MTATASTVTATASTRARRREDASAPRPFPWNQSRRRARPSRRARACTHRRDDLDDDASPSDRVRSSTRGYRRPLTRVVTSASSEMHLWERRARLSTTPSDDRHPPRVVCRAMEHFWYASRRRGDPSRRCRSRSPRRVRETVRIRWERMDGNKWARRHRRAWCKSDP